MRIHCMWLQQAETGTLMGMSITFSHPFGTTSICHLARNNEHYIITLKLKYNHIVCSHEQYNTRYICCQIVALQLHQLVNNVHFRCCSSQKVGLCFGFHVAHSLACAFSTIMWQVACLVTDQLGAVADIFLIMVQYIVELLLLQLLFWRRDWLDYLRRTKT